jgi:hypothetical protein
MGVCEKQYVVYRNSAHAVDELKEDISSVIRITADTLNKNGCEF